MGPQREFTSGGTLAHDATQSRGDTTIPAKVVARIAEQAANEVNHVGAGAGGVMGLRARQDFTARPHAECELYGHMAVVRLDAGVDFPVPLAPTLTELHEHVRHRVNQLTGLVVERLDVTVSWLHPVERTRRELR